MALMTSSGALSRLAALLLLSLTLLLSTSLTMAEADVGRSRYFTFPVSLVQLFSDEDIRWTISVLPAINKAKRDSGEDAELEDWHELGELTVERDTTASTVILHMPSSSEAAQGTRHGAQPASQRNAPRVATMMYAIYCVESAAQAGKAVDGAPVGTMPAPRHTVDATEDEEDNDMNRRATLDKRRAIKGQCFFLSDATAGADVFVAYRVKPASVDAATSASRQRRRMVHQQHQSGVKQHPMDESKQRGEDAVQLQETRVAYKSAGALLREVAEATSEEEGVVLGRAHVLAAQLPQSLPTPARTSKRSTANDAVTLTWLFALDDKSRWHKAQEVKEEEQEEEEDVVGWVVPRGMRLHGTRVSPEQRERERRLSTRRSRQLLKATSFTRRWVSPLVWAFVLYGLAWLWSYYATWKSKTQQQAAESKPKTQ